MLEDLAASPDSGDSTEVQSRIKQAIMALHEEQHTELMGKLKDVRTVLNGEIGRTSLIARTSRHLYDKIVALRIAQDDHLESEEAFVLPELAKG